MTQNLYKLWVVLLIVSVGIALWFSGTALLDLWKFARLNAQAPATVTKWEIRDLSSSRFAVEAEFLYEVNGTLYSGKTVFESHRFLNRFAAENHVKLLQVRSWQTWYRESNPSLSSLEREFPQKQCLQALLTIGVFTYFYFARNLFSRIF
jgi:hypothetical protein